MTSKMISSIIVSIAICISGYFISKTLQKARFSNRSVTVKGLSEREVKADLANWAITIKVTGDDLISINNKTESNIKIVKDFLLEQGFKPEEFELSSYSVNDILANSYRGTNQTNSRYIIQATIMLKTKNVEMVKKASSMQYMLSQKGVVFGARNDYDLSAPIYIITRFNELKAEMLSEAIKNARKAAKQFAVDSDSKIGKIKSANQGSFVITASDDADEDGSGGQERRSITKKIRVVSTLEYFLE